MIPFLGLFVTVATFPGVIVHEIAHQLFCRLFGVAVLDVCYFRVGRPAGYVIHEHPRKVSHHIWIGIGPFFVNTVIGALIALPAAIPVLQFETGSPIDYFLIWLGVSIAMHAFPSTGDAQSIWSSLMQDGTPRLVRLVGIPIVGLIYLGALGSIFWLDLMYGVFVALLLPSALVAALA